MKIDNGGGRSRLYYTNRFAPRGAVGVVRHFSSTFSISFYAGVYHVANTWVLADFTSHVYNYGSYQSFTDAEHVANCLNNLMTDIINGELKGIFYNSTVRALNDFKS